MKQLKSFFILIFLFSLLVTAQQFWKPQDKRIDTGDEPGKHESWDPQITAFNDNVYAVWHDNRDGDSGIYFNLSTDRGQTWWERSIRISTKPGPHYLDEILLPQIGVLGENIYIVWEQTVSNKGQTNIYFNHSQDGGFNWQPAELRLDRCDQPNKLSFSPKLAFSGDSVYVVWLDTRDSKRDVFFNSSHDRGISWQAMDVSLNSEGAIESRHSYDQDIAVWDNNIYVVWENYQAKKRGDVYFNTSKDSGASWKGHADFMAKGYQPKICCREENIYLVWKNKNKYGSYDILFNRSNDQGETWLHRSVKLNNDNENMLSRNYFAQISCIENKVYVIWANWGLQSDGLYFRMSSDQGITWQPTIHLNPLGSLKSFGVEDHHIACTGENIAVVWRTYRKGLGGWHNIYFNFSTDNGMSWQPTEFRLDSGLNTYQNGSFQPQLRCQNDSVYVVWEDARNGFWEGHWGGWLGLDIYFNSIDLLEPYFTLLLDVTEGGIIDPGPGSYMIPIGSNVLINAFPEHNFRLISWTGDVIGGDNPIQVTMDSNKKIQANFERFAFDLTIKKDGAGTTDPLPGDHSIDMGTEVIVTAIPNINHAFTGWSRDVISQENPITIIMNSDTAIQAHFERQYKLKIKVIGGGVTHPSHGAHSYNKDTVVVITAVPHKYNQFTGWSGDLSGSTNPASIIMDSNKTVNTHFQRCIYAPSHFTGSLIENRFLFYIEYINLLKWEVNPFNENIAMYRLYLIDAAGSSLLLSEIPSGQFEFMHRRIDKNKTYTYLLKAVDASGREGDPAHLTMK